MVGTLIPEASDASGYAPLDALIVSAIRRSGDFSSRRVESDVVLLLSEVANEVIELLNGHPYWDGQLDYYVSQTDRRPVPDIIMVRGLLAGYYEQQGSQKFPNAWAAYMLWLNQVLYTRKYGGSTRHELLPVENSSSRVTADGAAIDPEALDV